MGFLNKKIPATNQDNIMRAVYNEEDKTLTTSSFITSKIGNKIEVSSTETSDDFLYYDGSDLLYTIRIIYTDNTKANLLSVERIN